jgi:lipoprotein-anchoring transpeptidase ErfK/SrfK
MTSSPLLMASSLALGFGLSTLPIGFGTLAAAVRAAEQPTTATSVVAPAPAATATSEPTPAAGPTSPRPQPNPAVAATTSNRMILLSLSRREISLERDGKVVGSWPVVIGAPATPTPTGTYKVVTKVLNPKYQSTVSGTINHTTGPAGPLGDRWLGFHSKGNNDFGIHGTPWPWWVDARAAVSHGCVRMKNEHVLLLFDQVDIGTPVVIKP